jgi:hypothetical protein
VPYVDLLSDLLTCTSQYSTLQLRTSMSNFVLHLTTNPCLFLPYCAEITTLHFLGNKAGINVPPST